METEQEHPEDCPCFDCFEPTWEQLEYAEWLISVTDE